MTDLKVQMNEYLFLEFGVDGDESSVSENWPFELHTLIDTPDFTVFGFQDDEAYFALAEADSLNFLPQAGMTVDDLLVQRQGATWIGERDPVNLSTARLGDPVVPSTVERRRRLEQLGEETLPGAAVKILEGLFLASEQTYLALYGRPGETEAKIVGLPDTPPISVPFPDASPWRRLAWGVGSWVKSRNS